MWFSWRPRGSIALVESSDGIKWGKPVIVLGPDPTTGWEEVVNRPAVVQSANGYHLWYTGQRGQRSSIGYATGQTDQSFQRRSERPVLSAELPWEGVAAMAPHVLYDPTTSLYRMWYSAGENYEPNAIGYATSLDGLVWAKYSGNPVFRPASENAWERDRVAACQVVFSQGWYLMFYIGFSDPAHAQIGVARSRDGITGWERHRSNPIIQPSRDGWDADAVYKPFAIFDGSRWLLWYNGRRGQSEQIGLAIHEGEDLGF